MKLEKVNPPWKIMSAPLVQTTNQDIALFVRFIVTPNVIKIPDVFNGRSAHGSMVGKIIREGDFWARPQHGGRGFSDEEVSALTLYVTCTTQHPPRMVLFYTEE